MSVQLAARGPQDLFLTGNPTTTFFKAVFRQYVDFEIITEDQTKNNRQKFDTLFENQKRIFQVLIPNKFEYLSNIYISFKSKHQLNAYEQFDYARLKIGGQTIVDLPFEFIYIYDQLNMTDEHISKFYNNHNINDTSTTYKIKTENTENGPVQKAEFIYYVMLPFFTKRYQTVLPLYLLTNHIVEVEFKTKNNHKEIYDFKLFTDYIHIDSQYIYGNEHSLLIEQFQRNEFDFNNLFGSSSNTINTTIDLLFNHPIKELIWVFDKNNDKVGNYASHQIFDQLSIKLEGSSIFTREQIYYSLIQHIQHHTRCPDNIFSFSFSLFPTGYQPSGTINASKIRDFQLDFENINKRERQPVSSLSELKSGTNYILDILDKQSNIVDRSFLISIETLIHFINEKIFSVIPSSINQESSFSSDIDDKIFNIYNEIQDTTLDNSVYMPIRQRIQHQYLNDQVNNRLTPYDYILYPNNIYPIKYDVSNINISTNTIINFDNYVLNSFYSNFITLVDENGVTTREIGYMILASDKHADLFNSSQSGYFSSIPYDLYFDFINYFGIGQDYEYFYTHGNYSDGIIISNTIDTKNIAKLSTFSYKKAKQIISFNDPSSTSSDKSIDTIFRSNPADPTSQIKAGGIRTDTHYSTLTGLTEDNIAELPIYNYYKSIAYVPSTFYSTINNQFNWYSIFNPFYLLPSIPSLSNYIGVTIYSQLQDYYPNPSDFTLSTLNATPSFHTSPNNRILNFIDTTDSSGIVTRHDFNGYYYRDTGDPKVNYSHHLKLNSFFYIHDLYQKFKNFMLKLFDKNTTHYKDNLLDININEINIQLDLQEVNTQQNSISCSLLNLKSKLEESYVDGTGLSTFTDYNIINQNRNADSIVEFVTLLVKFHLATNVIFRRFPIGADFTQQFMDYSNIEDNTFVNVQHIFNNFQVKTHKTPTANSQNFSRVDQPMIVKYIYDAIFSRAKIPETDSWPRMHNMDDTSPQTFYDSLYSKIQTILNDINEPINTGGANYPLYRIQHNTLYELSYDNSCFINNIDINIPPYDDSGSSSIGGSVYTPPNPNYAEYFGYGASLNYIYNNYDTTTNLNIKSIITKTDSLGNTADIHVNLSNIKILNDFYYDVPINSDPNLTIQNGKINNDTSIETEPMSVRPRLMLLPVESISTDHTVCPKTNIFKTCNELNTLFNYLTNTTIPDTFDAFSYKDPTKNHGIFDSLIRFAFNVYWEQALQKLNLKLFDSGIIEDKELNDSNFIQNTIQSLKVYAVNYNFLDFENGRAGLKFRS